jgi:hypothetical protein
MNQPHVHATLIHQWADGAEIEIYDTIHRKWGTQLEPHWRHDQKYRVKPPPLNAEQEAFLKSVGNIAMDGHLVRTMFATDDFWGLDPSYELIQVYDMYLVWRDALNFAKQS